MTTARRGYSHHFKFIFLTKILFLLAPQKDSTVCRILLLPIILGCKYDRLLACQSHFIIVLITASRHLHYNIVLHLPLT